MAVNNYTYTQEDELGFVTTSHGADVLQDTNEVRQILQDLGEALSHAGFNNATYPKDKTPHPYVRGAHSDTDFEIKVSPGKVIKFTYEETGGNKTLYFKYANDKISFSYDGTNYYSFFISSITNPEDGQWLKYDEASGVWINFTPTLNDLSDVECSPGDGHWLKWDGERWVSAKPTLDDLDDVVLTSPTVGDVLKFDGTTWVNEASGG